jgi:hypothetical protein
MSRAPGIALMLLLRSPVAALASGMLPFCQYSTNASGRIENARYRLHDACPNVFLVTDGAAQIGDRRVPVPALRRYFEQQPLPIAFPGR